MAEVLKRHVEQCPEHPMSKLKQTLVELRRAIELLFEYYEANAFGQKAFPLTPHLNRLKALLEKSPE
jgi:hypothetical protein